MAGLVQKFTILVLVLFFCSKSCCWGRWGAGRGSERSFHSNKWWSHIILCLLTLSKNTANKLKMASHYFNSIWEINFSAKSPHLIHLISGSKLEMAGWKSHSLPPPHIFISLLCEMSIEKKPIEASVLQSNIKLHPFQFNLILVLLQIMSTVTSYDSIHSTNISVPNIRESSFSTSIGVGQIKLLRMFRH